MGPSYNSDVLTAMIRDELDRRPRGTPMRLAEHTGVTPQTVTKWRKGEVKPEADRWPLIEAFFEWDEGEIARRVVPVQGIKSTLEIVRSLTEQVAALAERLAEVERKLDAPPPRRGR